MTKLPVHSRFELGRGESIAKTRLVRCPEETRWISAEGCARCARCTSTDETSVTCDVRERGGRWPDESPIAEVLDPSVLCVDESAAAKSVAAAMEEHGAAVAIVVDSSAHAIGVVSRVDVANASPTRRVETCMTPFVITLLDSTTVADAIDMVLERGVSHVPVLADGRVVGVVTPRAVIRWLAHRVETVRRSRTRPRG